MQCSTNGTGRTVMNLEKYKKSVYTILWSYSPYVFFIVILESLQVSPQISKALHHFSTTAMLMSSTLNPFLNIWRLREIREAVKQLLKKVFCKGRRGGWGSLLCKHRWPKLKLWAMIILRDSGHGANTRVCMGIFTIGLRR